MIAMLGVFAWACGNLGRNYGLEAGSLLVKKIDLPRITERMRGFTLPEGGAFFVVDYDEVFRIALGDVPSIEVLDDNPYSFMKDRKDFFGVPDNTPFLEAGNSKVTYNFSPEANSQVVTLECNGQKHLIQFRTLSGDWFVASLDRDGSFLTIAEPYLLELYDLR